MKVPAFFVKKAIVKGSFRNVIEAGRPVGFELTIKNKLGLGTLVGCSSVVISGNDYPIDKLLVIKGDKEYSASDINESMPLTFKFGDEIVLRMMDGKGLDPGKYEISTAIDLVGIGRVDISYKDELKG